MLKGFLARLPLTDRITFTRELLAACLFGVFNGLAMPLIPIVARRIGMSTEAITAMVTMQFVGALFGIFIGHATDRLPKLPLAVWPALVSRAAIGLLAFARTPGVYLAVVSVFYLLINVGGPAYASIMRSNYSDAHRARLMGDIRIAITLISAGVSGLAAVLLSRDEAIVRWLFPVAAAFGVASSLAFNRIRVRRTHELAAPAARHGSPLAAARASAGVLRRNVPFLLFMGLLVLTAMPDKAAIPLEPVWLVDHLRVSYGAASLLLGTVSSLAAVAGYVLWPRLARRMNVHAVLAVIVILFAARFVALGLSRSVAGLVPMSILNGISTAGWDLVPMLCMIALADRANFSLFMGLHTTLFGLRGLLGPSLGTLVYSSGILPLPSFFLLMAGIIAAGGVLTWVFSRSRAARAGGYSSSSSAVSRQEERK